jgi:AcrR family transcriptional regulator
MSTSRPATPSRSYLGVPHAARRSERRRRLLAAGIEVFGGIGVRHATVKAVCQQAQLTERYFYESFDGMEQLLIACYQTSAAALRAAVEAAVDAAEATPSARMRAALGLYFKHLKAQRHAARLLMFEIEGVSERADAAYRAEMRWSADLIRHRICAGLPARAANGLNPDLLAAGVVGAVFQLAKEWLLADCAAPQSHLVRNGHAIFMGVHAQWVGQASAAAR